MIQGSIVAIVTPMHADGSLDLPGLKKLIDWHIAEGTDGIVIVGTTGESPTVTVDEHCELIKVAVDHTAKRIPIIAGTGGNSTVEAIELTRYAKEVGADASLQVVPYYNRPTQEGMYRHFCTIADAVNIPVLLYNVPGRTACDMVPETVVRLSKHPRIVGIKEATGDLSRADSILAHAKPGFVLLSGDDPTAVELMKRGACGVISVTANVAPRPMHDLCAAALARRHGEAVAINERLMPLHLAMFIEANPIPVKWAVAQLGLIGNAIRLPLTQLSERLHDDMLAAMKASGITQA